MNGVRPVAGSLLLVLLVLALVLPCTAQQSGTVTRGGTFTVTVVGLPRTLYDVWPKGTWAMSGEPGDQPPVIVAGQAEVTQDPPGGPYTIGSHPISGGGTLRGDVPPDSSTTPATSYYASVRTDASGHGIVLFRTSSATATGQQFHIVAQNPADLGEDVGVFLGGLPSPSPTPVIPLPLPTTMTTPFIPVTTTQVPVTVTHPPPSVLPTAVPLITPTPEVTPTETAPVQGIPIPVILPLAAAGAILVITGKAGKR